MRHPTCFIAMLLLIFTGTTARAALVEGFSYDQDINTASGSYSYDAGTGQHSVLGDGADIWDQNDRFHFAYEEVWGDCIISAKLVSQVRSHDWSKAGVMIRNELNENTGYAFSCERPGADDGNLGDGTFYQGRYRPNEDAWNVHYNYADLGYPTWLKLERLGNTVSAYWSADGITYTQMDGSQEIDYSGLVYVGLAVTSHVDGTVSAAVFEEVDLVGDTTNQRFWDELGDGGWYDDPSRWLDAPPPAGLQASVPYYLSRVTINTNTLDVGADASALGLHVAGGGGLAIGGSPASPVTLTVGEDVYFGGGTAMDMAEAATLAVTGGGRLPAVAAAGDATIRNGGDLSAWSLTVPAAATLAKQGDGRLSLDNSTGSGVVADSTSVFKVEGGTLASMGAKPLGDATQLILATGTFQVRDGIIPGTPPIDPAVHWAFDETSGSTATNSVTPGANDGMLLSFATDDSQWVEGIIGGALHFDGLDDSVDAGTSSILDDYSVTMWVKADSLTNASVWDSPFSGGGGGSGGGSFQIDVGQQVNGTYQWRGGGPFQMGPVDTGWVHLAVTFDSVTGNLATYYNGQPTDAGVTTNTALLNYLFGRNRTDDRRFAGTIDDAYVYDRVLSDTDVEDMFGTSVPPNMASTNVLVTGPAAIDARTADVATFGGLTMMDGAAITTTGTAPGVVFNGVTIDSEAQWVGFGPEISTRYAGAAGPEGWPGIDLQDRTITFAKVGGHTMVVDAAGLPQNIAGTAFDVAEGVVELSGPAALGNRPVRITADGELRIDDGATLGTSAVELAGGMFTFADQVGTAVIPADPLAHWAFDDATGLTAANTAAPPENPTLYQGALLNFPIDDTQWVIDGKVGGALELDGVDDYVEITAYKGIGGTEPRSMAAWVRTTSGDAPFLAWGENEPGEKWAFRVQTGNGTAGAIRVEVDDGHIVGDTDIRDDQWHHVAAILPEGAINVSQIELYVDGIRQGISAAAPEFINTDNSTAGIDVVIGGGDHQARYLAGTLDEVYLFDRALTGQDVEDMAGVRAAPVLSGLSPLVTDHSVLNSRSTSVAEFGVLRMQNGALTTTGLSGINFAGTTIINTGQHSEVGFDPQVATDYRVIDASSADVTIVKAGTSTWVLNAAPQNLENADWRVDDGRLELGGTTPLGNRPVVVAAGTLYAPGVAALGTSPVILGGGALEIEGALTMVENALGEKYYGNRPAGDRPLDIDPLGPGQGLLALSPDYDGIYDENIDFNFADDDLPARAQGTIGGDNFGSVFHGRLVVQSFGTSTGEQLEEGDITLALNSDDGSNLWLNHPVDGLIKVVDTNYNHGSGNNHRRWGAVNLPAGEYDVYIGQWDNTGGDGLQLKLAMGDVTGQAAGGADDPITDAMWDALTWANPGKPEQAGTWKTEVPGAITAPGLDWTVTGDSTLYARTALTASFSAPDMVHGVLTTLGAPGGITLAGVNIVDTDGDDQDTETVGFNTDTSTELGVIDAHAVKVTISTDGLRPIVLDQAPANMENADWEVRGGVLQSVGADPAVPLGSRPVTLAGGTMEFIPEGTGPEVPGGAIAHYSFNDPYNIGLDSSGNGMHGTPVGNPGYSSGGMVGGSIQFDGLDDGLDLNNGGSFLKDETDARTVSFWMYQHEAVGDQMLFDEGGNTTGIGIQMHVDELQARIKEGDDIKDVWDPNRPLEEGWHHVAVVFGNGQFKLYLDGGAPVASIDAPVGALTRHTNNSGLGYRNAQNPFNTAGFFNGLMDEVYLYNAAVDDDGVQDLYDAGTAALSPLDLRAIPLTVVDDSILSVRTDASAEFASLTMQSGTLTTAGASGGISFDATTISAASGAVLGIETLASTRLGVVTADGVTPVTFVKSGTAALIMQQPPAGFDALTLEVQGGPLVGVRDALGANFNPFGVPEITLNGGEVVLAGKDPQTDVAYADLALSVESDSIVTAGSGFVGGAGPLTATLGSETSGITINNGVVSLRSTDGYTLNVAGPIQANSGVMVTEGMVTLAGGGSVDTLEVTGGTAETTAPLTATDVRVSGGALVPGAGFTATTLTVSGGAFTPNADVNVGTMEISGGAVDTGDHQVVLSNMLALGSIPYSIANGTFGASSENLLAEADLTLSSGTLTIGVPPQAPAGFSAYFPLNEPPGEINAVDESPNNYVGDVVEAEPGGEGKIGTSFYFDGDNDWVDFGANQITELYGPSAFTVAMWFKRRVNDTGGGNDTNHAVNNVLLAQSSQASSNGNDNLEIGTESNTVELYVDHTGGGGLANERYFQDVPTGIDNNTWYHLAVTYDENDAGGAPLKLYFDSQLIREWTEPNGAIADAGSNSNLSLGAARLDRADPWGDYDGWIDDLFIYDRALTASDVFGLFSLGDEGGVLDAGNTNLVVTDQVSVHLATRGQTLLGDLAVEAGVPLVLSGGAASFRNITAGHDAAIVAGGADSILLRGIMTPGGADAAGILNVLGEMETGDGSTYVCDLNDADHAGRSDVVVIAGLLWLGESELTLNALSRYGDTTSGWGDQPDLTVVDGGDEGMVEGVFVNYPPGTNVTTPGPTDPLHPHLGHGVFLGKRHDDPTEPGQGVFYREDPEGDPGVIVWVDVHVWQAAPGDVNGDRKVDFDDIWGIVSSGKYDQGPAPDVDWTKGDCDDNGQVDFDDIWAIVQTGLYDQGSYAATSEGGPDDNEVTIFYNPADGDIFVETNQRDDITGIKLLSASGIFTGPDPPDFHPAAMFTRAIPTEVSSAAFGAPMVGDRDYGLIAEPGHGWELLEDLTLYYTIAGVSGNQEAKLFVIPEPGTLVMLGSGLLGLLLLAIRRRRGRLNDAA